MFFIIKKLFFIFLIKNVKLIFLINKSNKSNGLSQTVTNLRSGYKFNNPT
jgi:hypothetical protein